MAEKKVRGFARTLLERRTRILLRDAKSALTSGRDEDLHATRIGIKRLRYSLEFFQSVLLEESVRAALELLATAQERLGTISDADAFVRFYDDLADHLPEGDPRATGIAARRSAALAERERALQSLRALWKGGGGTPYPETLAASISSALGSLSPKPDS